MDLQPYSNPKVGWQEQRMWLKVFVLSLSQKDWHDLWLSFLILVFCHALFINVEKKKTRWGLQLKLDISSTLYFTANLLRSQGVWLLYNPAECQ